MGQFLVGAGASWILGAKFHSGRAVKKIKTKFQKEQKELYSQYYNDVYKLTETNQELQQTVQALQATLKDLTEKHELEAVQRDYDEFKQPDIDGDDRISRAEFNMYVKNYLSNYPGLQEKDYPRFEDFDHDGAFADDCFMSLCYILLSLSYSRHPRVLLAHIFLLVNLSFSTSTGDGYVSFQEYSQQMALQAQKAEMEQMYGDGNSEKTQAYQQMAGGAGMNDMYAQYR